MRTLIQDLRYGVRMLVKNPGFTVIAILALALGIGANTAIFSVVNAVLLRPLPYRDAERIVWVEAVNPAAQITRSNVSPPDFLDLKNQSQVFEDMAAFVTGGAILSGGTEPERIPASFVTANFFSVLGVKPAMGREFRAEEDRPGGPSVVVISHGLWQRRFGADPSIVGSQINVSGESATVVGVMPPRFEFLAPVDLWQPLAIDAGTERRDNRYLQVTARLKPGVPLEQAQSQLNTITERLGQSYVETNSNWSAKLTRLHELIVEDVRPALLLLLGAVGFVLLITCANVANLLLARAAARQKEIAVRSALGASRMRVIRQLLTESLLLSVLGGGLGLLLSVWLTDLLISISPSGSPRLDEVRLDGRVLVFTLLVTGLIGLLFGLAPALQASHVNLNEALKEGGRSFSEGWRRNHLRKALVVAEVALSLMLLVGAGLLIKSFVLLNKTDPGFSPENVLTMRIGLPSFKYKGKQKAEFFQRLTDEVASLPGVESAGAVLSLPLGGSNLSVGRSFIPDGRPLTPAESINAAYIVATPGYFRTMKIPLAAGRSFTERDTDEATKVVVVNETLARRVFPGESAVGKRIRVWRDEDFAREIIGVVGDTKSFALDDEPAPQMYVPHAQDTGWGGMSLVVRTTTQPTALTSAVRAAVLSIDKDQPVFNIKTMEDVAAASVANRRIAMFLLSVFAGLALLLAALGVYGVISYSIAQRTHEIGLRMALGAQRRDVMKLILRQGMGLVLVGIVIGLVAAFALTRVMASLLYEVSATDPLTFTVVALILGTVALLACLIPARRAMKVDPMVALRYE
ncbi:MAG TPA: ABC transporter permease [Pyrinomonadaceae bacterium]|jgi:putative ABC transport system permease protein|nr:ABC transporter permease [Pyrinomonadaceae bacterium]